MYKLLKLLGVLAVVASSVDHASALSISASPIFATQTTEEFSFSWSGSTTFSLSNLSFSSPPGPNLLTTLSPFTTSGGTLSGSGKLSEILSVTPGTPYTAAYTINGSLPNSINVQLSPVPLPAAFPLFAMALLGLGLFGYHTARSNGRFYGLNRQLANADSAI
jgi:hypothetical protein